MESDSSHENSKPPRREHERLHDHVGFELLALLRNRHLVRSFSSHSSIDHDSHHRTMTSAFSFPQEK